MTQFLRDQASDSEEVVTPLMLDGTYLSRNFATLGPLIGQPPCGCPRSDEQKDDDRLVMAEPGQHWNTACRLCHLIKGLEMNTDSGIYVPAPAVRLMKSRVLSRPGVNSVPAFHWSFLGKAGVSLK